MARRKKAKPSKTKPKQAPLINGKTIRTIVGLFAILFSVFLLAAFVSFFYNWQQDQSILSSFTDKEIVASNHMGKVGAQLSHFFIYKGFGVAALAIPFLICVLGGAILFYTSVKRVFKSINWCLIGMTWIAVTIAFMDTKYQLLAGTIGVEINMFLQVFIGKTGLALVLAFGYLSYLVMRFKLSFEHVRIRLPMIKLTSLRLPKLGLAAAYKSWVASLSTGHEGDQDQASLKLEQEGGVAQPVKVHAPVDSTLNLSVEKHEPTIQKHSSIAKEDLAKPDEVLINIEQAVKEVSLEENKANELVTDFGEFDPTLDLSNFEFPPLRLLPEFNETISVNEQELEANKDRIVESLKSYKIEIAQIKATVGPTVTLYEIVPAAGVRISKIKNLEDDIALSLSALGIRIIAPIPGKGTIGIEVPNSKPTMVSMRSVIASSKFQNAQMELPIALGKTISNETFVFDLSKMPHLLMAGATGQGKSVGLNAVLTSLLYKKHPAEIKFVLVDPKKVELTLFNKIERHYLAKLPDSEEAIITDTNKVVHTLNSLCIEMDARYELLKVAMVRNIKEYNTKFKARKLNPDNGHHFLPYIVLVIDEFADLIMTAGKEVEIPIARLAQLARAIGIHLIVATQRPSVNVITGLIKANFPARIAFRVTSKIDSRTILDASGADQLIGKGDLLYSGGSDIIRIQCAFVDTPEVEKVTDFVGSQRAYPEAYLLPEYVGEDSGTTIDVAISERDAMFEEAAKVVVGAQQGSTSLIQRKLKLGYNRAGRIVDQLEAAGILGPFEGSKARQVLVSDLMSLDQMLEAEKTNP